MGRRVLCAAFALIMSCCFIMTASGGETTVKTEDVLVRDPFILVEGGRYYMYGTGLAGGPGYGCRVSDDLENWGEPHRVFTPPEGHTGDGCWWAPECHKYKGAFYLFATYHDSVCGHRGVAVFRADSPLGPFEQISDGFVTPDDTDSIDGTLYVDPRGVPYMVYVMEWTSRPDGVGRMAAVKLSDDLTRFDGEPVVLFKATDGKDGMKGSVTDGPFVYTLKNGRLIMLWSNMSDEGYAVGTAAARKIDGRWRQQPKLLYKASYSDTGLDGGHGMVFTDLRGELRMAMHSPNMPPQGSFEHAVFPKLVETGTGLMLETEHAKMQSVLDSVDSVISTLATVISAVLGFIISLF